MVAPRLRLLLAHPHDHFWKCLDVDLAKGRDLERNGGLEGGRGQT